MLGRFSACSKRFSGFMQALRVKILCGSEISMSIARYFVFAASKSGDLVTATGREVALRLTSGEEPQGVFVEPVLDSSQNRRSNQAAYREARAELVSEIKAELPETDELICLSSKDEIVRYYTAANPLARNMMRIQHALPSETRAFVVIEAISNAERTMVTKLFGLDPDNENPVVAILMNDKYKVAAHIGENINGSMLDETGNLKPWTAAEGSLMEEVIRARFPQSTTYAI